MAQCQDTCSSCIRPKFHSQNPQGSHNHTVSGPEDPAPSSSHSPSIHNRTFKDFQAHIHTHKIEINQAATTASRTNGAVSPLETNETKLLLESTAPIWAAQMDKIGLGQAHPQVWCHSDFESFTVKEKWCLEPYSAWITNTQGPSG